MKTTRFRLIYIVLCASVFCGSNIALAQIQPEKIPAPTLSAQGRVYTDAEGVPTIDAANDFDAAFLLGYTHASARFFQMDYTRRAASGTLSELVGAPALANDIQLRNLGLRRAAVTTWQEMSAETRGWLKFYADGVNLWLKRNPLPNEYTALELTKTDPWSPVDSIVIGKILAFQLSFGLDIDLTLRLGAYQQAGQAGGFSGNALFFEDTHRLQPPDNRTSINNFVPSAQANENAKSSVLSEPEITNGESIAVVDPVVMSMAQTWRDQIKDVPFLGASLQPREDRAGSNWWILGPSKTVSGKPILANDPHLGLDLPSTFVEVHIISRDSRYPTTMNVVGSSVPGTPTVLLGCTEKFCWGLTTNPLDVTDVFQEQIRTTDLGFPRATAHGDKEDPTIWIWQNYIVNKLDGVPDNAARDNSIGYSNGGLTTLVPRRNFGPIVQVSGNSGLSVAYTGWGASFELEAFRRISRSNNMSEFRDALTYFDVGSQNFAYADVEGNFAYFTSAEMPIREDLQTMGGPDAGVPPFLIRDGTGVRKHEWLAVRNPKPNQALKKFEILSANEMPFVINPAQGYIANANNDPIGTTFDNNALNQLRPGGGVYYLNFAYSPYRIGRIDRMLQSLLANGNKLDVATIKQTQSNNQLLDAELVLPYLLDAHARSTGPGAWANANALAQDAKVLEAIAYLRRWNYSTPTGIKEGFDPGDNPTSLPEPSAADIDNSIAATLFAVWRGQAIRNTIDANLTRVGLGSALPSGTVAYDAFKYQLDQYATRKGVGLSGVNFFTATGSPSAEAARDFLLLKSLRDALDRLSGEPFAAAFNRSSNLLDYRWGKLHRIVFKHPLGGPFDIPGQGLYGIQNLAPNLLGVARSGGYESVDAAAHNTRAQSANEFMFGSGPARRFVGEMTTPISAEQILPGGQSGVLGDPLYISQLPRWLTNGYKPLVINAASATGAAVSILEFDP